MLKPSLPWTLGHFSCASKHFQGPLHKRHHRQRHFVQPHQDKEGTKQLPWQICGRASTGNKTVTITNCTSCTDDKYVLFLCDCFFNHIGPLWIQPAYKRSRHAGESYNSGQSSGCSHWEPGLWENERGDGGCLWSPGPHYRWVGNIAMNWYNVLYCCKVLCCAVLRCYDVL